MFTVDELLSKRNQRDALQNIRQKKDGKGSDGVCVSEFEEYWRLNHQIIETAIRSKTYQPGVIMTYEILNRSGKKREVSSLTVTDRFITRLLSQKMKRYIEPQFLSGSFAYCEGKGILEAVLQAQKYINEGDLYVATIDVKNFFDTISIEKMLNLLQELILDETVMHLIRSYLYCKVENNDQISEKKIGLVQGNSMSPIMSNLYLHALDRHMEQKEYHWIRFADDIHIYAKNQEQASEQYTDVCSRLKEDFDLQVNEMKSGVFLSLEATLLGYDFYRYGGKIEVKRHKYQRIENYNNWHRSSISKMNQEYHIVQNGVLNKKDYSLLFENDKEKHYIPVEALNQISIYSDVSISSSVLRTLTSENIKLMIVDKYGNLAGTYIPVGYNKDAKTALRQMTEYINDEQRMEIARSMELAGLHNIRANLRYYSKKKKTLVDVVEELSRGIEELRIVSSIDNMMLIEARARQAYYKAFNDIIGNNDFLFLTRTKHPPKDEINAMISFGNTLLYNQILQQMWNTSLNPQIGVVHSTNRRSYSLHLDFADIFKPIIVDRVIFSLINKMQIKKDDFFSDDRGAVLLSDNGKRVFLNAFREKMESKIVISNKEITYRNIILDELRKYQQHLFDNKEYKPYKYY